MIKLNEMEKSALHLSMGVRHDFYDVEVLDKNGIPKGTTVSLLDGQIDVNSDYDVKKSGFVELEALDNINLMSDKLQIFMHCNEFKWSLGIFMISNVKGNRITISDETVKLQQAKVIEKKVFKKGSYYIDALKWFIVEGINSIKMDIQSSTLTLTADIIIDDTKNMLQWFNYIADQINYRHLYVDANGYFKSEKYKEPSFLSVGYRYFKDQYSVLEDNEDSEIDFWSKPNVFKRIVSRGDLPPLVSIYTNDNPASMFSTINRGFKIVDVGTVDNIATQEELDLYVSRIALKSQQLEEVKKIITANMPQHEIYDIIELEEGIYEESSYSIDLSYFGKMTHYLRRVIYGFEGIR